MSYSYERVAATGVVQNATNTAQKDLVRAAKSIDWALDMYRKAQTEGVASSEMLGIIAALSQAQKGIEETRSSLIVALKNEKAFERDLGDVRAILEQDERAKYVE
jgi:hypothetical protein